MPTTVDAFRTLVPRHTKKHLARRLGVAIETAKQYLTRGLPEARERQLAREIGLLLEERERELIALRAALASRWGNDSAMEAGSVPEGGALD